MKAGLKAKGLAARMRRFLASEEGPTAVEYACMLALIVIVCIMAIQTVGIFSNVAFDKAASKLGS